MTAAILYSRRRVSSSPSPFFPLKSHRSSLPAKSGCNSLGVYLKTPYIERASFSYQLKRRLPFLTRFCPWKNGPSLSRLSFSLILMSLLSSLDTGIQDSSFKLLIAVFFFLSHFDVDLSYYFLIGFTSDSKESFFSLFRSPPAVDSSLTTPPPPHSLAFFSSPSPFFPLSTFHRFSFFAGLVCSLPRNTPRCRGLHLALGVAVFSGSCFPWFYASHCRLVRARLHFLTPGTVYFGVLL